jgi:hypothetical protein
MFFHIQNIQTLFFSNVLFSTKCAPFLLKIGNDLILTLMIIREKRLELMKIVFITNLRTFGSKMLLKMCF